MDYPKSVPNVGLVNGKFIDENPSTGQVGSLIPSAWGNAVTQELLSVITAAGLTPDENQVNQLLKAIQTFASADMKKTVKVATTGAIALSGLQLIDGVALVAGDRVLVKNQAAASQNGIYSVQAGVWMRAQDADENIEISPGMMVPVQAGTVNYGSIWQLSNVAPPTVGSTALTFEQIVGNTGIAAGTYKSLTVDRRGRAIAGTNPTTLAGHGIVDAMPLGEGGWGGRISSLWSDIKAIDKTGFTYQVPTNGTLNGLGGAAGCVLTAIGPSAGWQIYIRDTTFLIRGYTGSEWTADLAVWHSGNFNPLSYAIKATTLAGYGITDAYTVTAADALLKLKATLASPAFTGKPTAPTAALGTNDSQLANTAFVQAAIAAVIAGAPGALDTLKELADALGGDPNFANTIVNGLAGKANKGEVMPLGEGGWGRVVGTESIDMKAIGKTCFTYQNPGGGTLNGMGPSAGTVLHAESAGAGWQMYIRGQSFLFRSYLGSEWSETFAAWHSGNLDPNTIFPVGTSIDFAGPVAPAGFLKENGAAVSRVTYARLFEVIGTRYGAGNGSTTFNLPDSRGEVFRGLDDGRGVDPGRGLGSVQLDQVQGMKFQMPWGQGTIVSGGAFGGNDLRRYSVATTLDQVEGPLSDGVNGTPRIGAETRMRNVARLKCIKY